MSRESNRRVGRFIKADDPVRKVLTITDFNLMEICEKPFTFHDNANANIIHQKLHFVQELSDTIRDSHEIDATFPHENRPVIRPLDFTEEWRRQKKRMANRNHRLDEEEELDLDGTPLVKPDLGRARYLESQPAASLLYPFFQPIESLQKTFAGAIAAHSLAPVSAPPPAPTAARVSAEASRPSAASRGDQQQQQEPVATSMAQGFVPVQLGTPPIDEKALEAIRDQARAEGYQKGFEIGEEKGTLQAQQKVQSMTEELRLVIENLEGMQHTILGHVQENFITICQSFIEALLHKEFQLHPESFGRVIERAIKEAVPEDEFRIIVSPQVKEDLAQWTNATLRSHLKSDDSVKDFEFRIEGKNAVVDAKISDIVKRLLDQADLQLFEDPVKERAS